MTPETLSIMHSSSTNEWATPQEFYDKLDREFGFEIDVAATDTNAKCPKYFTIENSAFDNDWAPNVCWMNPPYGRELPRWLKRAHFQSQFGATVVCLVPARTDTRWFWDYCAPHEIRFVKGRLKFVTQEGQLARIQTNSVIEGRHAPNAAAPFPSMVIIMRPGDAKYRSPLMPLLPK